MKTYYPAAKIINDTSEHLGRYGKVMALQDSVVTVGIDFDTIEDFDAVVSLDNFYINGIISFIDSPASTSALTYTLMQKSADGTTTGYFESGMGGTAIMQISLTEFTP